MTGPILIAIACLMGAAGVILAAAAAHSAPGSGLDSASSMLLFHAPAVIAAVLAAGNGMVMRPLGLLAASGFVVGALLFAGDIAMRAYIGHRLFPMAAPSGGIMLIASWLTLAAAALAALGNRS
jgi:uncharacterized membrane protein YgdD (TMEM256/DUF423 family)